MFAKRQDELSERAVAEALGQKVYSMFPEVSTLADGKLQGLTVRGLSVSPPRRGVRTLQSSRSLYIMLTTTLIFGTATATVIMWPMVVGRVFGALLRKWKVSYRLVDVDSSRIDIVITVARGTM